MTNKEQISTGITTAKNQATEWAMESITNAANGNNTVAIDKKIVALVNWIDILEDYYNKKYNDYVGMHYISETEALELLARMNELDFNPKPEPNTNPEGDFDLSFDNSFT